jgi:predicted alpha/beta superfamily hydrolase
LNPEQIESISMREIITITTIFFCLLTSGVVVGQNTEQASNNVKPFILGVIDEIQSSALSEKRILNIYLPEGYKKNDTTKYPVVYLLDGSADEDFIHIVGLYQFNNFPWIARVPASIIIGIASVDRRRDFTYPTTIEKDKLKYPTTGKSSQFISFLERELQPFIEKKYRANSSKTIIGQSLGGLLVTEILLTKASLFTKYIIVSPSLWWDNGSLLKRSSEILLAEFNDKVDVYIGVGKEGLVPGDNPRVMEVDANLLAEKIKATKSKTVNVYFDYLPNEDHATILHPAIFNALRVLYPKKNSNN